MPRPVNSNTPARPDLITRFHVMAILQAARAYVLGLDLDEAKSWGLNRALFYAAANRGWQRAKAAGTNRPVIAEFERSRAQHDPVYVLGGEKAFRARNFAEGLRFKFGAEIQEPEDFDDQVKRILNDRWDEIWLEALEFMRTVHRRDLDIQSRFYNRIYKPRRDLLVKKWSAPGPERRPMRNLRRLISRIRRKRIA